MKSYTPASVRQRYGRLDQPPMTGPGYPPVKGIPLSEKYPKGQRQGLSGTEGTPLYPMVDNTWVGALGLAMWLLRDRHPAFRICAGLAGLLFAYKAFSR